MALNLPTTPSRTAALTQHERQPVTVLELALDKCQLVYSVGACTAPVDIGNECHNTFHTCKAKSAYLKGSQVISFVTRGTPIPPGELLRPYILSDSNSPTMIDIEEGVSRRASVSITLADEPDSDIQTDPYFATRPTPAGGTFWPRLISRNPHYVGRFAKVRRGFAVTPWDWTTFLDELYIIEAIDAGLGQITITLKDPLKLADRNKIPKATDGKITTALKRVEDEGFAVSGTATTINLQTKASAVDEIYTGMEVYITGATGIGQRRVIAAYVGATRTATVAAWSQVPDSSSTYEVGRLSISFPINKGAQYTDPATSGKREFIRIGGEIIEYTAKSGDTLSWPSTASRAQFGTERKDASIKANAQLCRAFINTRVKDVVKSLLNESGVADAQIDLAQLLIEDDTWLRESFAITACISAPESATSMLSEIMQQTNMAMWFSPQTQQVEFRVLLPLLETAAVLTDEANFIEGSVEVEVLNDLRITSSAIYYAPINSTGSMSEAKNFNDAEIFIDVDAEGLNEYNDKRPTIEYSRWFGEVNGVAMKSHAGKKLTDRRDAPSNIKFKLDPKDYSLAPGQLVDISTKRMTNARGIAEATRCVVTKVQDQGSHIQMEARTTTFTKRWGFVAPNGTADYPTDKIYCHINSNATGKMPNGDEPYKTI